MNEAALRARSLTLADGQVVVPIEDVLDLAATPSGGPLDTLRALNDAARTLVEQLDRHGLDNLALFEQQIRHVRGHLLTDDYLARLTEDAG